MSYLFERREIGEEYRISIYQDEDAECPCTDWDLLGVYFWDNIERGYNRGISCCCNRTDAKNAAEVLEELVCKYVSQKKIVDYINSDNVDDFSLRYDRSERMWYLENLYNGEWYTQGEFEQLNDFDYREELCDILDEDDFAYLLQDCKSIAFYEWSSSGYSQGDYVSGYAYCDKERFTKFCDTNTKNWRKRALEIFDDEVNSIGLWMWGDVKGFVLEKKVHYKKVFTEIGREPVDDYDWEQVDSCWGEYYEDTDELIKDALAENGIKYDDAA